MSPGENGYLADYGITVKLVETIDDLMAFKRWAGERRDAMGVDTETSGLRPDFDRIRLIQFGDQKTGWAIPWEDWGGGAKEILRAYDRDIVLHNSKFDVRFITANSDIEWPWHRTHDTMTMAHLVDPLRPKGLKPLAGRLVDPQAVAAQKLLDNAMHDHKWTWETVPIDYQWYWVYAAMDPILTCHIYDQLKRNVPHEPYDLEMGATRVVAKMERNGTRVSIDYCEQKSNELMSYAHSARAWLAEEFGISNPTRGQLIDFFKKNDIPMLDKTTKGGGIGMDKEVLESIDHPVAQTVLNIRKAEKLVGPYFKNFIDLADDNDRVHANVWTMGTRTARMSITDPALQTLPKRDTTVRTAFVPEDGYGLISSDYSQIEARLMAHFSGAQGMIDAFNSPNDFFLTMASMIFQEQITDKKDHRRQLTKNTIYGKIYGAGAETIARTAGVAPEVGRMVVDKFSTAFPEVERTMHEIEATGKRRLREEGIPYVQTPTGRRLACDDGKYYALTNYLIQSHAAEIFKKALVNLDSVLPSEVRLLLPIHDEVVAEAPLEIIDEVAKQVGEVMSLPDTYRVPIVAEGEWTSTNWGDLVS